MTGIPVSGLISLKDSLSDDSRSISYQIESNYLNDKSLLNMGERVFSMSSPYSMTDFYSFESVVRLYQSSSYAVIIDEVSVDKTSNSLNYFLYTESGKTHWEVYFRNPQSPDYLFRYDEGPSWITVSPYKSNPTILDDNGKYAISIDIEDNQGAFGTDPRSAIVVFKSGSYTFDFLIEQAGDT